MPRGAKLAAWIVGVPLALLTVLYLILLVTPIRLPFAGDTVRGLVQSALPPGAEIELGDMALALEQGVWPVIQFSPVTYKDSVSGARVAMEALEVGFSPLLMLVGKPGATVTIVAPHIQLVQDLYGPRLTTFEMEEDPEGGPPTLKVLEGEQAFPPVGIAHEGVVVGSEKAPLRSDNDWLVYNLESAEVSINDLVEQIRQGRFSKLTIRDGTVDMSDSVYQLFRRIEDVSLTVGTGTSEQEILGSFSANIGNRQVTGTFERVLADDGTSRLKADVINLDFAALLPFIDDASAMAAMRGAGALSIDVGFDPAGGTLMEGIFRIDLTGVDLRIGKDYFPVASSIMEITWNPSAGQFVLADSAIQIGQSNARVAGTFAMGLDPDYGPTIGISLQARDVSIHPNDLEAPTAPFTTMEFSGWSAPLYGAMGIDRFVARRDDTVVETIGRIDMLRDGMGLEMTVAGKAVTADDLKRLWPYIMGGESRDWFVANVPEGRVVEARLEFNYPVGTLTLDGEDAPTPEGAMSIDMLGEGVKIRAVDTMPPIAIDGLTRLQIKDSNVTISASGGEVPTRAGPIRIANPALVMDNSVPDESIMEISGSLKSSIASLVALAEDQAPDVMAGTEFPLTISALTGDVDLGLVATIGLPDEESGREMDVDYVVTGTLADFASSEPIQDRRIGDGQLSFSATQDNYVVGGTANIDGMVADISVAGTPETAPNLKISSSVAVSDLKAMGFDASPFLTGRVKFSAEPQADGALKMVVDLADAGLTIKDIGITKAAGTPGTLTATVRPDGETTHLEEIDLGFGTVRLKGGIEFHATKGLVAASFDTFALSQGDSAQVAVSPMDGGYAVRIRGKQLDLKPVVQQFFDLNQGSGGVQTTQINQTLALDVRLDRAVGYYATTAFNVNVDLLLRGSDMRRATVSTQFGEGNALSITTNPAPRGRSLSVAFNDAGTILRFLGIYSQLAGGSGSLVLTTDRDADAEAGRLLLRNFAIVDEANVAQILGNHSDSRAAIAARNRLDFDAAQVDFVRRKDRVEVTNGMLTGDTVGGTARGFIYTDRRQYDLNGTYVPLFGLNNAFQKIPLLGPLLGGRDGEGLVGVTFAIRGPLDNPQFAINPLSILLPGAFRELFEFRARELPPAE
ncbi:AsmA-like C-terminal domain-containing protein [Devosia sp. SD17-2]|uniref:AsmA-like C-terminal domain-containing protein n=1 Tax=Devosia sp. SD17-2 TaxID=2976459 RepID=UPI0023D817F7|nr:AsmA-like C-terminal domain-containing protein [Devosia sp. SD17-2]WEJ31680.1 AsmA-like C-terminal domain-containing protein [Devosia sp. SD17-2]